MDSKGDLGNRLRIDVTKGVAAAGALLLGTILPQTTRAEALSAAQLAELSIEDLGKVEISSVSKTTEPLSDAPAAVYVITHDSIIRSGAVTIPDILRLAPNLQVVQTSASQYVITARGFSGNAAAQNFSDKLLVLIDGRSVYTPLYSGVYWDMQDVFPEDIDRIEVISGPGATLWGANAVNGVINIITRKSGNTQGGILDVDAGDRQTSISLRYGGRISDALTYRAYIRDVLGADTETPAGDKAHDSWRRPQGGLRLDWSPTARDVITLQGDAYRNVEEQQGAPDQHIAGGNLLGRWNHSWQGGSALQIQAYYDRTERETLDSGGRFKLDTYDLDVQYNFAPNDRNQVVLGGGYRTSSYRIVGTSSIFFSPSARTLRLGDVFAQDTFSITATTKLVLGLKLENDPYSGVAVLPNARISWRPNDATLLWAAASRAVRSPTPFDRDVGERIGSLLFLVGGRDFQPEDLTAYEIGARVRTSPGVSFSISTFYNVYDKLRSIEFNPVTLLPLQWGNGVRGETYGVEIWGEYRVTPWWRMTASYNELAKHLRFAPRSSGLLGVAQEGDDPKRQASLRSSMNLGSNVTLDGDLRYVGALPDPRVPAYVELNGQIGWRVSDRVRLSLSGFNLLHPRHQEFPVSQANPVGRSALVGLKWAF